MTSERAKKSKPYRAKRFGILNAFGDIWTPETFASAAMAQRHIDKFWAGEKPMVKFSVVPVRVTVASRTRGSPF